MLVLNRSPQQDVALAAFLKDIQDPASPSFRKFLTPQEFGGRFGLADADIAQVDAATGTVTAQDYFKFTVN